jgi:hypothetical protein
VKVAGIAAAALSAVALGMPALPAMGKPAFTPPEMSPPPLSGPSDMLNPRFKTMKARSAVRAAERGIGQRIDLYQDDSFVIRDSRFNGDVIFVLPSRPRK